MMGFTIMLLGGAQAAPDQVGFLTGFNMSLPASHYRGFAILGQAGRFVSAGVR